MIKLLLAAFAILSFALNGADLKSFPFYKDASAKKTNSRAVSSIKLDSGIYSKTLNLSSDLRIIDAANQEIPFALRRVFVKNTYKYQGISASNIESLNNNNNTVVITVKQNKKPIAIDSISLDTPSMNFEKSVSIEGCNDNKSWNMIAENQSIFDYSSIIPLQKTEIKIPRSNYEYFRVSIHNFSEEKTSPIYKLVKEKQSGINLKEITSVIKRKIHLKIDAVNLISLSKSKTNLGLQKQNYPIKISTTITKKKKTIIELNSDLEPLTQLSLSSSSTNFSRQLSLQASNDKKKWRMISNHNWSKSNIFNKSTNNNKINFSELRYKYYKIIIKNGDNPVLQDLKVSASGNIYRMVMLGKQALELKLYYGGSVLHPQYEIGKILPAIMDFKEINYQLSQAKANPLFDNSAPVKPVSYKWLFIMCIILISIILIIILYKNLGKLDSVEESETQ